VAFLEEVIAQCSVHEQMQVILDNLSACTTRLVHQFVQGKQPGSLSLRPKLLFLARGVFTSVSGLTRKLR
jgi:hypothetical protein